LLNRRRCCRRLERGDDPRSTLLDFDESAVLDKTPWLARLLRSTKRVRAGGWGRSQTGNLQWRAPIG
jgi:hypothetical protein